MKNKITIALTVLALGASALVATAQDNNNDSPPAGGPPPDSQSATNHMGGRGGPRGFHLLPPRAEQRLQLTDDQKQQIAALQTETQAKLEKILTPEQMKQLENMHPPMRQGGRGGPGGRGNNGGDDANNMPPGNDGGGNNPPPGPPSGDN